MFEVLIARGAAERPDSIAVRVGTASYSFAQMEQEIRHCAAWLGQRDGLDGRRVLLHLGDPYLHWVLFFALEAHGAVSIAEVLNVAITKERCDGLGASLVFSSLPDPGLDGVEWVQVNPAWVGAARRCQPAPLPGPSRQPGDPICIILSSGTTGATKSVLLDRAMMDRRTLHAREAEFLRPGAGLILTLPFQSVGGVLAALQAWLVGGTLGFHVTGTPWTETFARGDFDTLVTAPIHLEQILKELPPETQRREDLVVLIGGGATSRPLADAVRSRLTSSIATAYGTTESSLVTKADIAALPDAVETAGPLLPWAEVEIVNADGSPVPQGESGEIRLRGSDVVPGYLDDPIETARFFRDGWYYPGDLGRIDRNGLLLVSGRVDDLMNFGGRKAVPATIEAIVLGFPGIKDAAAFQARDGERNALWVAYSGDAIDPRALSRPLQDIPHVLVAHMAGIPRNPMGKVERARLRDAAEALRLPTIGPIARLR